MSLYQELKRRNVLRVAAAYTIAAWLLVQVAETIFPLFGYGDAPARIVVVVLAIGFVPAIIISWAFEITPEGLKRDADVDRDNSITPHSTKKLDRIIIAALVVALAYFAFDKFVLDPQRDLEITASAVRTGAEQAREEARLDIFSDKSIAVLPFENRSELKDDEYFTAGMHDELLTRLSRISALKVISRTSVMKYRGIEKSIPDIGKELSVAVVLEGGVQRSGDQVRINVQLIDARTDEHLWAEIYDRELTAENLFVIQSEISTDIADSLEATLSPEERTRVYDLPTSSLEAYNHYLRGRQSMASRTVEGLGQALAEFEQAADIDPEFALAWVGIGDSVHLLAERGGYDWDEHIERHQRAAEQALALNDQLGEAYTSMAMSYVDRREHEKKSAAFDKAFEFNPNYAQAYLWYANTLTIDAREEKRLPLLLRAAQLDPLSSLIQLNIASHLASLGQFDESRDAITRLLEMDPNFGSAHRFLGRMEAFEGHLASAIGRFEKAIEIDPRNSNSWEDLAMIYIALGDLDAVGEVLANIDKTVGRASVAYGRVNHRILLAEGKYAAAIAALEAVPERWQSAPTVLLSYADTFLLSRDYQSVRDFSIKALPFLTDPDQWQQEVAGAQDVPCEYAAAMHNAGDDMGRDLLRFIIRDYEARVSDNKPVAIGWHSLMVCYLADGSQQIALDILERESTNGTLIDYWWFYRMLPWWEPLEDDPRYQKLVTRMEELLDRQRALLPSQGSSK